MLLLSTCHIQIVGKAEEDGPGIAGQIVADPGQHGRHIYGLRGALDTDHPGPAFRSWDLQEEACLAKEMYNVEDNPCIC